MRNNYNGRLFGLLLAVTCTFATTINSPASAVATAANSSATPTANSVPTVGEPCQPGARGVDSSGYKAACGNIAGRRVWVWSDQIGIPPRVAVPDSWRGVTTDVTGANAVPLAAPLTAQFPDRQAMAAQLVAVVNGWRAAKGIVPLTIDPRLERLSKFWAEKTGTGEYLGGTGAHCPRTLCAVRSAELGYTAFGEVMRPWTPVPSGNLDAERYFVDSPGHFAILTDPRYSHIGFAFHIVTDTSGIVRSMVVVGQVGRSR